MSPTDTVLLIVPSSESDLGVGVGVDVGVGAGVSVGEGIRVEVDACISGAEEDLTGVSGSGLFFPERATMPTASIAIAA